MFLDVQAESLGSACWVGDIIQGTLELYVLPGGILGVRGREPLFVEFLAGKGLNRSVFKAILSLAPDPGSGPVEAFFINPRLAKVCEKLGWKPVGTYMRFDNGRTTEGNSDSTAGHEPEGAVDGASAVLRGSVG